MENKKSSRRRFIQKLAIGTVGLALAPRLAKVEPVSPSLYSPVPGRLPSKVILIKHSQVIESDGRVHQHILDEMLRDAMLKLTGEESEDKAWSYFFSTEEMISLKINTLGLENLLGTNYIQHFTALTLAITKGLSTMHIQEKNIIIWDRSDEELISAGYTIHKEEEKLKIMGTRAERRGTAEGFDQVAWQVGDKTTHVHEIITRLSDSYINVPVIKSHRISGVTGALKNHYGSIDNPREFHENNATNPGIPEINAIQPIRDKQKLIIADALFGVYDGGPRWSLETMWPIGALIVGTDPVAVDTIMLKIINQKRDEEGLDLLEQAVHLAISEQLGLGNHKIENINLIEINAD